MITLKRWLFPDQSRGFTGKRWLMVSLRTLHLIGLAGIGAVFLFDALIPQAQAYLLITLFSGILMVCLEIWTNGVWLIQLKGLSIVLKMLLLWGMLSWPNYATALFIFIVVISGVMSHAPGYIRYYSPWHHRRI